MLGLSKDCHGSYTGAAHSQCNGTATRPHPGITAHIEFIHHPQPAPGESLTHTTAKCACPCHIHRAPPPPPQPPVDTPT